ncbi:hypothetical protein EJB05_27848 [Eragrostis curvula]|uniref:Uncharacterized protein n=1 Tax=Eragrostis curvula TaxID=38414 RepID=A0A5J9UP63_9POAL|nr:hypothetical protein EJB05_27848 [Eragrostis curvula]
MAHVVTLLFPAFLLLLAQGARSEKCSPSSVEVALTNTGARAGTPNDPVFEVTVRNRCRCAVHGVFLRSAGFASSVPVDPKLFRRDGSGYLVGNGRRIESNGEVRFQYAWDRAFHMFPIIVQDSCS